MYRFLLALLLSILFVACSSSSDNTSPPANSNPDLAVLADSLLAARHTWQRTDILSRKLPDITREQAFSLQLAMLQKELRAGHKVIGYKMGGTAVPDERSYDPIFGYMLDANLIAEDSVVSAAHFPGGSVMVEAEIGFRMKQDFPQGASSLEELKAGVDYVFNAVEFAQSLSMPVGGNAETMNLNHTLASGMGHAGVIVGQGRADVNTFDFEQESVSCYINGEEKASGISSNVYGTPLNALYSLVNLLPTQGLFLKKGDIVVSGSLYTNPVIHSTSTVQLKFKTLGEIDFQMR